MTHTGKIKMTVNSSVWWKELESSLANDPSFVAEGIALDLSIRINEQLERLRLTRKALADRLNVSQARVSQIMGGQINMTLLTMCRVALAVGLLPRLDFQTPGQKGAAPLLTTAQHESRAGGAIMSTVLTAAETLSSLAVADVSAVTPGPDRLGRRALVYTASTPERGAA